MCEQQMLMDHRLPATSDHAVTIPGSRRAARLLRPLLGLLTLLLLAVVPAAAQHVVAGRVTATGTGEALSGVQIVVQGTATTTLTDADGRYRLTAPSGSSNIVFSRLGYGAQTVQIA